MATAAVDFPLPPLVLRNLSDRSFDKRKAGAQEVEKIMRRLRDTGDRASIRRVITLLSQDFACSVNNHTRKGGLIGLASCAIGLTTLTTAHLDLMVPAVLKSFSDQEPRVRYYACESLFNIIKICRGGVLPWLNEVFTGVCKLVADVDADCKNGAALFDRLLKEIVMEAVEERERLGLGMSGGADGNGNGAAGDAGGSGDGSTVPALDLDRFIPLIRSHMPVVNPYVRQLLVGWIVALDSAPGLDMLQYLPSLLEGLFDMLSDGNREVRQHAYSALGGFLDHIVHATPMEEWPSRLAYIPLVGILIAQTGRDREKFNRVTAVEWLSRFIAIGREHLAPLYAPLTSTLLRCLSDPEAELVEDVARANASLMGLVRSTPLSAFDPTPLLSAVISEVPSKDRLTRSAALRWVAMLLGVCPDRVRAPACVEPLLSALLSNLLDTGDGDVLKLNLEVLARLAVTDLHFLSSRVLVDLVRLFGSHRVLLEQKASFILRRLCLLLDPRLVYLMLAGILENEPNREFASLLVELLNLLLLTSLEAADFRDGLRGCAAPVPLVDGAAAASPMLSSVTDSGKTASNSTADQQLQQQWPLDDPLSIFVRLFRTWSVNPLATISLCLLCQAYGTASQIVSALAETQVTVGLLMQTDKLVQLLESPVFLATRMHLLQPERPDTAHLLRSLYGLLMLLPQGTAFTTLRERLHAVTSLHISINSSGGAGVVPRVSASSPASAAAGSTAATPTAYRSPYDEASLFAVFNARQTQARQGLSMEIRARSLMPMLAAQLPPSVAAAIHPSTAAADAIGLADSDASLVLEDIGSGAVVLSSSATSTGAGSSGGAGRASAKVGPAVAAAPPTGKDPVAAQLQWPARPEGDEGEEDGDGSSHAGSEAGAS